MSTPSPAAVKKITEARKLREKEQLAADLKVSAKQEVLPNTKGKSTYEKPKASTSGSSSPSSKSASKTSKSVSVDSTSRKTKNSSSKNSRKIGNPEKKFERPEHLTQRPFRDNDILKSLKEQIEKPGKGGKIQNKRRPVKRKAAGIKKESN